MSVPDSENIDTGFRKGTCLECLSTKFPVSSRISLFGNMLRMPKLDEAEEDDECRPGRTRRVVLLTSGGDLVGKWVLSWVIYVS